MLGIVALIASSERHAVVVPLASPTYLRAAEKAALRKAIAKRSVVMLGELTHGDGTTFQFKTELVKFLHAEMGFSVLVWESGFYDCAEMDKELSTERPLAEVASMGVFSHWSRGRESFPVFEYARLTQKSKRPLRMAGFDLQNSGTSGNGMLPDMLAWFGSSPELPTDERTAAQQALETARAAAQGPNPDFVTIQSDALGVATLLAKVYDRNPSYWQKAWGAEAAYRRRALASAGANGEMLRLSKKSGEGMEAFAASYNLRERVNAENLKWLVENRFRGQKLIVWGHNVHLFKGLPGIGAGASLQPRTQDLESTGRLVAREFGSRTYVVGVMAHGGSWSWLGNGEIPFVRPTAGSIEAWLHGSGHAYGFVDLRSIPTTHPLREPMPGVIDRQNPFTLRTSWAEGFDGILFIDKMQPRHQM